MAIFDRGNSNCSRIRYCIVSLFQSSTTSIVEKVIILELHSFYLPESPSTWSIFTEEERVLAVTRLNEDGHVDHTHMTLGDLDASNKKQALKALTDWKVWMYMIMFFCGSVPNTSISK